MREKGVAALIILNFPGLAIGLKVALQEPLSGLSIGCRKVCGLLGLGFRVQGSRSSRIPVRSGSKGEHPCRRAPTGRPPRGCDDTGGSVRDTKGSKHLHACTPCIAAALLSSIASCMQTFRGLVVLSVLERGLSKQPCVESQ